VGLYLSVRFASTLGTQIQSVAVGWQVYDITRNPVALGFVGLSVFLPMLLLVLPAGDLADRVDRRRMLMASYLVQTLTSFLLLLLTLTGVHAMWAFYSVITLLGVALGLSQPAIQSFLPFLVTLEKLPQAIAWNASAYRIAIILGPALGGFLYDLGPATNYGICFCLYVFTLLAMWNLRIRAYRRERDESSTLMRIKDGINYMRRRPILLGAISLDLFAMFLGGTTALLPIFARDILHTGPWGLGFLRTAPAMGAAVVAFTLARWQLHRHVGMRMFTCVALFGVSTIVFGLSRDFYLSFAALAMAGAGDMVSVYVRSALVQLATPDHMRGRVGSLNSLFVGASNELGEFRAGMSAGLFGTVPAVVIGGFGTLAVVSLWMWMFPPLRRIDRFSEAMVGPERDKAPIQPPKAETPLSPAFAKAAADESDV
ncbi:MAG TPA: MFS transporter, partial [Micropepsaceae bacterium]|nr:MFS transporter [Micropepsaceae bacterium]